MPTNQNKKNGTENPEAESVAATNVTKMVEESINQAKQTLDGMRDAQFPADKVNQMLGELEKVRDNYALKATDAVSQSVIERNALVEELLGGLGGDAANEEKLINLNQILDKYVFEEMIEEHYRGGWLTRVDFAEGQEQALEAKIHEMMAKDKPWHVPAGLPANVKLMYVNYLKEKIAPIVREQDHSMGEIEANELETIKTQLEDTNLVMPFEKWLNNPTSGLDSDTSRLINFKVLIDEKIAQLLNVLPADFTKVTDQTQKSALEKEKTELADKINALKNMESKTIDDLKPVKAEYDRLEKAAADFKQKFESVSKTVEVNEQEKLAGEIVKILQDYKYDEGDFQHESITEAQRTEFEGYLNQGGLDLLKAKSVEDLKKLKTTVENLPKEKSALGESMQKIDEYVEMLGFNESQAKTVKKVLSGFILMLANLVYRMPGSGMFATKIVKKSEMRQFGYEFDEEKKKFVPTEGNETLAETAGRNFLKGHGFLTDADFGKLKIFAGSKGKTNVLEVLKEHAPDDQVGFLAEQMLVLEFVHGRLATGPVDWNDDKNDSLAAYFSDKETQAAFAAWKLAKASG